MVTGVPAVLRCRHADNGFTVAMVSVKEELTIDELSALKARVVGKKQHIIRKDDVGYWIPDPDTNEVEISVRFPSGLSNSTQLKLLDAIIRRLSPLIKVEAIDVSELTQSATH